MNNVLTVFNRLLKMAVEWGVLDKMLATIVTFYDFAEYARLVEAAGPRSGESIALEWPDIDFRRGQLHLRQTEWRGLVTVHAGDGLRDAGEDRWVRKGEGPGIVEVSLLIPGPSLWRGVRDLNP